MREYNALGLMSGTSLDGLDMAYVNFIFHKGKWSFKILQAETLSYDSFWRNKLEKAPNLSAEALQKLHMDYGHFLGKAAADFIERHQLKPDLISSHGHTVFHNPQQGYTLQIGAGAAILAHLSCTIIFDFRSQDVALGGQGAPLVPIGDELLFGEFAATINLGGFANISKKINHVRVAWDIAPANFILNHITKKMGLDYDHNGEIARKGQVDKKLLSQLNQIDFYRKPSPKSLGREWVESIFWPATNSSNLSNEDLLSTFVEHISDQVSRDIKNTEGKILFTGGGAKNGFLMERISAKSGADIHLPKEEIIDFKEALIFALMGVLRLENKINIMNSVTGASQSISAGSCIGKYD